MHNFLMVAGRERVCVSTQKGILFAIEFDVASFTFLAAACEVNDISMFKQQQKTWNLNS